MVAVAPRKQAFAIARSISARSQYELRSYARIPLRMREKKSPIPKEIRPMKRALALIALSLFALPACVAEPGTEDGSIDEAAADKDIAGTAEGKAVMPIIGAAGPTGQAGTGANGINYNGGPVMNSGVNVYLIWYGNFAGGTGSPAEYKTILTDLAGSIGGSPYYNITTTYTNASGAKVPNTVTLKGSMDFGYLSGKTKLTDTNIQQVVSQAISSGKLGAADANGLYFVLTSKDVTATSGFCTQYCGWHTHGTISGTDIKYSFVGDPARCPSACQAQTAGPNGTSGADGAASIFAHELEEAASDPDLNAWYDSAGAENADKCAWTFGTEYTANGKRANMKLGTRDYLIQRNWVNASGGYCSTSY